MAIPDFQSFMLPLLQTIGDGGDYTSRDVAAALVTKWQLTSQELAERLPSGQQTIFTNRIAWAKAHLKRAGLLESPSRGTLKITELGRQTLEKQPEKINLRFLTQFPNYDWHLPKTLSRTASNNADSNAKSAASEVEETPEELLESSYEALREKLAVEVLEKVKTCSPAFFEQLVVQLLVAMGYGGSLADAGQAIGKTGDGGIDGIIKEDKLGLDVVCIQAKRWENSVGRPVVQAFAGSMEGMRARKGVLLTTASFSRDAIDYVSRIERKIILIDGTRLADLMIEHDIGVATARSYVVKRLDLDYFTIEDE